MVTKDDLIRLYESETKTTAKVIRAVPVDKLEFKVHDKSMDNKAVIKMLGAEMVMAVSFLKGEEPKEYSDLVPDFDSVEAGAVQYEAKVSEFLEALKATSEDDLDQKFDMWGMNARRADFVFMLMLDMIHHRGQLSVYVRLSGGLVPSIYGPSADDNGGFPV